MPETNVTLNPTYKQYYTITSDDAAVIIKVDDVAADKALKGQTIKALAPNKKVTSLKTGQRPALIWAIRSTRTGSPSRCRKARLP